MGQLVELWRAFDILFKDAQTRPICSLGDSQAMAPAFQRSQGTLSVSGGD
jgi:hypothetical protein